MGLFSSDIERKLEREYVPSFQMMMGLTPSGAKSIFRDLLNQVKEESTKEGTGNLPHNFGDIMLERESTDEKIQSMLAKRRKEEVKDKDIKWWWNMNDLERRMILKVDDITRFGLYKQLREEDGLNEEEAAKQVRKFHPMYGDPDDTSNTTGDDRPLPEELKDRINIYIQKRTQTDQDEFKIEINNASSFNSLARKEIKRGNL